MTASIGYEIRGHGFPVVLLHSSLSSKVQWQPLTALLSESYRTIAIDLHGYGENSFPENPGSFSLAEEVRLVESILAESIGPGEPFHLVGHSYGGAVSLKLAYQAQERISSLTVFEPVAFHLLPADERNEIHQLVRVLSEDLAAGRNKEAAERFIDYWNGAGVFQALPAQRQQVFSELIKKGLLDFHVLFQEPRTLDDYRRIDIPTRLIGGLESPKEAHLILRLLAKTLPHNELLWVDGGHMSPITHAKQVNPTIQDHIQKMVMTAA